MSGIAIIASQAAINRAKREREALNRESEIIEGSKQKEQEWTSNPPIKSGWYLLAPLGDTEDYRLVEIITGLSEFIIKHKGSFNYIRDYPLALWQGPIGD